MDLFLTSMQVFTSQDVNGWAGVVWITRGLLGCFYELFGLSFLWHPFTPVDLLMSKWWNAKFIFTEEETNWSTSWMAWWWVCSGNFHFCAYVSFKRLIERVHLILEAWDFDILNRNINILLTCKCCKGNCLMELFKHLFKNTLILMFLENQVMMWRA